ncbi:hypothetical protein RYX36_035666 [Vicia faba]
MQILMFFLSMSCMVFEGCPDVEEFDGTHLVFMGDGSDPYKVITNVVKVLALEAYAEIKAKIIDETDVDVDVGVDLDANYLSVLFVTCKFGIFPSWDLSQKLSRIIEVNKAREVSLTTTPLNAEVMANKEIVDIAKRIKDPQKAAKQTSY